MTEIPSLAQAVKQSLDQAKERRDAVPTILESMSPEYVEEEMIARQEFRNDQQKLLDKLSDQINELERLKRYVRTAKAEQKTDVEKLDARRWDLIRSRPKQ